jgi:hypothetical protein
VAKAGRNDPKVEALRAARSLNPRPEAVTDEAFGSLEFPRPPGPGAGQVRDGAPGPRRPPRRESHRRGVRVLPAVVLPGGSRTGIGWVACSGAPAPGAETGTQADRTGRGLRRGTASRRSHSSIPGPRGGHQRGVRGGGAPPLHRARSRPPAGTQKWAAMSRGHPASSSTTKSCVTERSTGSATAGVSGSPCSSARGSLRGSMPGATSPRHRPGERRLRLQSIAPSSWPCLPAWHSASPEVEA